MRRVNAGVGAGLTVPPVVGGTAFLLCPLALLTAAAPVGEAGQLAAGALAVLLLATGMCALRQLATGVGLPVLVLVTAGLAVAAVILGTLLELPGVPVTVVVGAPVVYLLRVSRWRAGDASLVGLALALSFGVAYLLDNVVYDDNGSSTDQAVPLLVVPSVALALWVLVRTGLGGRPARASVVAGAVLGVAAFVVAQSTRGATFVPFALSGGLLFGLGLAGTGIGLIRLPAGPTD